METATQYLKFAETCERLARQVESQAHRASLIEMAKVWKQLAKEAEDNESGV
jgi:hypothetical protein